MDFFYCRACFGGRCAVCFNERLAPPSPPLFFSFFFSVLIHPKRTLKKTPILTSYLSVPFSALTLLPETAPDKYTCVYYQNSNSRGPRPTVKISLGLGELSGPLMESHWRVSRGLLKSGCRGGMLMLDVWWFQLCETFNCRMNGRDEATLFYSIALWRIADLVFFSCRTQHLLLGMAHNGCAIYSLVPKCQSCWQPVAAWACGETPYSLVSSQIWVVVLLSSLGCCASI